MSRIIVKQLPKTISEDKLRALFSQKGVITDIQLKYTNEGKFRQFCFIGYRTELEAQEAIKFFDKSCIQTSRIRVESCAALGHEDKPQSWSKYAKDSKQNQIATADVKNKKTQQEDEEAEKKKKSKKLNKLQEIVGAYKDDAEFQEFMKVHDKQRVLWANDAELQEEAEAEDAVSDSGSKKESKAVAEHVDDDDDDAVVAEDEKLAAKPISDLDYMKSLISNSSSETAKSKEKCNLELFTIKIHNVPYNTKRQDILKFFKPQKPYSVRLPSKVHGFAYVGFKTHKEMSKAMLKHKSFIKGKQVFFADFTEKNKITKSKLLPKTSDDGTEAVTSTNTTAVLNSKWTQQVNDLQQTENIAESGRIFFRNLSYTVTEEELQKLFEQFGPVAEVHLPIDQLTRKIKGFGTVTFVMPEHALLAFNKLDGTDFHGRLLHLIPGKCKDKADDEQQQDAALNYKQKKALQLKKNAQQTLNWNTLFLGGNAVADILAKDFAMSKEQILDTSAGGSSAAVRLALGETKIVIEMKKFLEEQGVNLSAFDAAATAVKRSKTVLLVKNLPADTQVEQLTPLFAKFGAIGRLLLPPSGVTALIEYCDASEARQAFKKLAYSKFKNVPLFLEWAPENTFQTTLSGEPIATKLPESKMAKEEQQEQTKKLNAKSNEVQQQQQQQEEDDMPPEANTTLFLRNLNFKTVPETIRAHFQHLGAIHSVDVAKRKDTTNPRNLISLGYGFIQFKRNASLEQALKRMQFTNIDGNQVELKRSDRTLNVQQADTRKKVQAGKQIGTKILVRNVPFQATHQEVRNIFKAFGEIKTLRLPKKMAPGETTHRGFGFVDFITKSDAKKAFEALSHSTHLYGRRLVLEWASVEDQNVEEIRKRTAAQMERLDSDGGINKRSKKAVFNVDEHMPLDNTAEDEEEDQ